MAAQLVLCFYISCSISLSTLPWQLGTIVAPGEVAQDKRHNSLRQRIWCKNHGSNCAHAVTHSPAHTPHLGCPHLGQEPAACSWAPRTPTCGLGFSRSGDGAKNLHSQHDARWLPHCWQLICTSSDRDPGISLTDTANWESWVPKASQS